MLTETGSTPSNSNPNWSASAQTSYVFTTAGSKTLYGWARDAANNISNSVSDSVTITLGNATLWEDTFDRANGAPNNGWTSTAGATGGATALINDNYLIRTDVGGYREYHNMTNITLPVNYSVIATVPNTLINSGAYWGIMGRYGNGNGVTLFWIGSPRTTFSAQDLGYGGQTYSITITNGFPASWSQDQNHTIMMKFYGTRITIYFDDQEYGYFTDTTNSDLEGTGIGNIGDGQGGDPLYTHFKFLDIKVLS